MDSVLTCLVDCANQSLDCSAQGISRCTGLQDTSTPYHLQRNGLGLNTPYFSAKGHQQHRRKCSKQASPLPLFSTSTGSSRQDLNLRIKLPGEPKRFSNPLYDPKERHGTRTKSEGQESGEPTASYAPNCRKADASTLYAVEAAATPTTMASQAEQRRRRRRLLQSRNMNHGSSSKSITENDAFKRGAASIRRRRRPRAPPSPLIPAAVTARERAAAAERRATKAAAVAEEAAVAALEAEETADRAVRVAETAAAGVTPRYAGRVSGQTVHFDPDGSPSRDDSVKHDAGTHKRSGPMDGSLAETTGASRLGHGRGHGSSGVFFTSSPVLRTPTNKTRISFNTPGPMMVSPVPVLSNNSPDDRGMARSIEVKSPPSPKPPPPSLEEVHHAGTGVFRGGYYYGRADAESSSSSSSEEDMSGPGEADTMEEAPAAREHQHQPSPAMAWTRATMRSTSSDATTETQVTTAASLSPTSSSSHGQTSEAADVAPPMPVAMPLFSSCATAWRSYGGGERSAAERVRRLRDRDISELSDSDMSAIMTASITAHVARREEERFNVFPVDGLPPEEWARHRARHYTVDGSWPREGSLSASQGMHQPDGGPRRAASLDHEWAASVQDEWEQRAVSQSASLSSSKRLSLPSYVSKWRAANLDRGTDGEEDVSRSDNSQMVPGYGVKSSAAGTFVETHLQNLCLSSDGTILLVLPEDGRGNFEFTLADLLEVKENIAEETVTLIGSEMMIKIAFEGQGVALQQFSAILAPTARGGRQSKPETSASEKCLTDLSNSSSSASSSSSSSSFASSSLTSSASYASASTLSSASLRWDKRSSSSSAGVDELFSTPGGGSISPFTSEDEPSVCPAGASSSSSPGRRDLVPSPLGNDLPSRRAQGRLLTLTLNQADPENEHEYDIDEDDLPIAHPERLVPASFMANTTASSSQQQRTFHKSKSMQASVECDPIASQQAVGISPAGERSSQQQCMRWIRNPAREARHLYGRRESTGTKFEARPQELEIWLSNSPRIENEGQRAGSGDAVEGRLVSDLNQRRESKRMVKDDGTTLTNPTAMFIR